LEAYLETTIGKGASSRRRSEHDQEVGSSTTKPKKSHARVPVHMDVAWAMYQKWTSCVWWDDIHLPDG
jgi:hypothetical protein